MAPPKVFYAFKNLDFNLETRVRASTADKNDIVIEQDGGDTIYLASADAEKLAVVLDLLLTEREANGA